jgi:lipoprotein-anchoring transpeptidase ErfK/SrfK
MTLRRFACVAAALFAASVPLDLAWAAKLIAKVDISTQTMTVIKDGAVRYTWRVSTGRTGFVTPVGQYRAKWASLNHRSRKYDNAPMPYAIFFNGGYAVHATYDVKRLGRPASHGCIRLHPDHAAEFFEMANSAGLKNTRIEIRR